MPGTVTFALKSLTGVFAAKAETLESIRTEKNMIPQEKPLSSHSATRMSQIVGPHSGLYHAG
jgi:hypothetical protein